MSKNVTMCVGTIGNGIWRTEDAGESWGRATGISGEARIYALATNPGDPRVLYAGAHDGIYRSDDRGASFERLDSAINEYNVWSVAVDPTDANIIFAGCRPGAVFRSRDGGQQWDKLSAEFAPECKDVGIPRVLTLVVDPTDPRIVWAGAEVDGVRRSLDGGDTWTTIGGGLDNPDIHAMSVTGNSPSTVLTCTPHEIYASTDVGESWRPLGVGNHFPILYCRGFAVKPGDSNVIFVGNGDGPAGQAGILHRSQDAGESWETLPLPVEPNTPIWTLAVNDADPDLVFCCSHFGQIFRSDDSGDTWSKIRREFSEIRALAWTPN